MKLRSRIPILLVLTGAVCPAEAGGSPLSLDRASAEEIGGPALPGRLMGVDRLGHAAGRGGLSFAPKVGLTLSTTGLHSAYGGAEAALWMRGEHGDLGLALEAGWSSFSRGDLFATGPGKLLFRAQTTFVPVLLTGMWRARLGRRSAAWLGVGGGAVLVATGSGQEDGAVLPRTAWIPEAHGSVGLGTRLGPGMPFLEARMSLRGDPRLDVLRGPSRSLTLNLGYRLDVF